MKNQPETTELLDKISLQTKRAVEIMRDFSNFSKQSIDENYRESISIKSVLESVLPLLRYEAETRAIKISCEIPDNLSCVETDRRGLEQVMFNLIINACQAMKVPGGKILITAYELDQKRMRLIVSDDGPGIDAEKQKKIFKSFYTTKEEGTGLGLYITKQLVERNDGTITVESEEGKGAQFIIELPKARM